MTRLSDDRVLQAIRRLGGRTYVGPLIDALNEGHWYSKRPVAALIFGASISGIYVALERLERQGKLTSAWGEVTYPERGDRRRRYYSIVEEDT